MPILDYTAGRGALNGVQAATANLINANQARAQGVQNGFLTAAQLFRQAHKDKEESTTRELENERIKALTQGQNIDNAYKPQQYETDIKHKNAQTGQINAQTQLLGKEIQNYEKNLKSVLSLRGAQAANASANAANTNLSTHINRQDYEALQRSKFTNPPNAMINFGAIINARKNYGDLQ